MILGGSYHYVITLVTLNITNKQLSDVLSELNSLQKNHKEIISKINKDKDTEISKAIERAIDIYDKKMNEILKHNQPPPKPTNYLLYLLQHRRKQE